MNYFEIDEFTCKCGCGKNNIDGNFLWRLNQARDIAGIPFRITSACRCEEHNRDVGGVDSSAHVRGYAVDIAVRGDRERFTVLNALIKAGFKRIGVGSSFIHVDDDPAKTRPVIWTY